MGDHEISFRFMDLSDVNNMMLWATDAAVAKFCRFEPYTSKQQAIDYIQSNVIPHPYHRAICVDNTPVGMISVTKNSGEESCRGMLGYLIASKWWGKGIVTRAVRLLMSTIFEEWPQLERLEALVDVENGASQRVLEKVGFTKDGVLRRYMLPKGRVYDMVMFSFLRSDLGTLSS